MAKYDIHDALPKSEKATLSKTKDNFPDFINTALQRYFKIRVQQSWQGTHILKGKIPTANALSLASNDYLSISHHPQLINAQMQAIQQYGNGPMQSPVF
ncbi:hypothetical protein [Legionella tunisiensis]|uniref:hypothetical protein n=1 Tax=Legionella tunisiensis TaxID=1034944 RepID=UPI00031414C0|nr:hypothetical protein [Legionella tunisiensis]